MSSMVFTARLAPEEAQSFVPQISVFSPLKDRCFTLLVHDSLLLSAECFDCVNILQVYHLWPESDVRRVRSGLPTWVVVNGIPGMFLGLGGIIAIAITRRQVLSVGSPAYSKGAACSKKGELIDERNVSWKDEHTK